MLKQKFKLTPINDKQEKHWHKINVDMTNAVRTLNYGLFKKSLDQGAPYLFNASYPNCESVLEELKRQDFLCGLVQMAKENDLDKFLAKCEGKKEFYYDIAMILLSNTVRTFLGNLTVQKRKKEEAILFFEKHIGVADKAFNKKHPSYAVYFLLDAKDDIQYEEGLVWLKNKNLDILNSKKILSCINPRNYETFITDKLLDFIIENKNRHMDLNKDLLDTLYSSVDHIRSDSSSSFFNRIYGNLDKLLGDESKKIKYDLLKKLAVKYGVVKRGVVLDVFNLVTIDLFNQDGNFFDEINKIKLDVKRKNELKLIIDKLKLFDKLSSVEVKSQEKTKVKL